MKIFFYAAAIVFLIAQVPVFAEERVKDVKVFGNRHVSTVEIKKIADIQPGTSLSKDTLQQALQRLEKSGKFERVEILKRFTDSAQETHLVIVIHVYEKESIFKRISARPLIQFSSEFGNSYGAEITFFDALGMDEAITIPLVFGGQKNIGIRLRKDYSGIVFNRIIIEGGVREFENPHFDEIDSRNYFGLTFNKNIGSLQLDLSTSYEDVEFLDLQESFFRFGFGLLIDTRSDSFVPDTSYRLDARISRFEFSENQSDVNQFKFSASGYLQPFYRLVIAANIRAELVDNSLPVYLKPYLGSSSRLRGYEEGTFIGDNLFLSSLEFRYPLSPIAGNLLYGLVAFYDTGAVYMDDVDLSDAVFRHGYGVGAFFNIEDFNIVAGVATNNDDDKTVVYVSSTFNF